LRWFKIFRDDLDRPAFSIGAEKFGLDFVYDVLGVWSFLCVENGPGVRQIPLSDDLVRVLARKFRVKPAEALARLRYMAECGLIDIVQKDGVEILGSAEIERRRDEWSRKAQKPSCVETPESLRSHSGDSPDTEVRGQKSEVKVQTSESRANDVTDRDVTGRQVCSLKEENPWMFSGVDIERVPEHFRTGRFGTLFEKEFQRFKEQSHEDGDCYCFVDEFLGQVREACKKARVQYPKALLARQIEVERA